MIGYFPDPYPDEILYSICARFADRMQYPTLVAVNQELWGSRNATAIVDLPCRLNYLVEALPPGHNSKQVEHLIAAHTLLPFYGPFLPGERLNLARQLMASAQGRQVHYYTGLMAQGIPRPQWLRFCPECVRVDRARFGECYWHRVHQVPGVHLCPDHAVWLKNSAVGVGNQQIQPQAFISAEQALECESRPSPAIPAAWQPYLLKIARDADWLLAQSGLSVELVEWRQRYKMALLESGLASYTGVIKHRRLQEAFQAYYPADLLQHLYCSFEKRSEHSWLARLTRQSRSAQHPLRHLLLIHFLGHSVETFLQLPLELHPFGQGPWPCLNPVCEFYRQPVIPECQSKLKNGRLYGTFACTCGFSYLRKGPDRSDEDRFQISRYITFGPVWEAALQQLWGDPSLSLTSKAARMGVVQSTLTRHAARLQLPFPPPGCKIMANTQLLHPPSPSKNDLSSPSKRQHYRHQWLAILKTHPEASRNMLRHQYPQLYQWLFKHDQKWFQAHLPVRRQPIPLKPRPPRVNWTERDQKLAPAVKQAAVQLSQQSGRPVRITKSALGRLVPDFYRFQSQLNRLPLTAQVLDEVVETHESAAIRRVQWAATCYGREGIRPTRPQLAKRAGVLKIKDQPPIQQALDQALAVLKQYSLSRLP